MDKFALELWFRAVRPNADVRWANEKSLLIGSSNGGYFGDYQPSFAVNLGRLSTTKSGDFENLHIVVQLRSSQSVSLEFVNELNGEVRFVRHSVYEKNSILIMIDIVESSSELTEDILMKYFIFFDEAVKRLKLAFPV